MFFTFVKGNVRLFCDGASYRRSKNTTEQWMFVERRWTLGNKKNKTCVTVGKPSMLPCMREKHHGSAKWGKEIGIVFAHITGHRIFSPQWVRHGKMGEVTFVGGFEWNVSTGWFGSLESCGLLRMPTGAEVRIGRARAQGFLRQIRLCSGQI